MTDELFEVDGYTMQQNRTELQKYIDKEKDLLERIEYEQDPHIEFDLYSDLHEIQNYISYLKSV